MNLSTLTRSGPIHIRSRLFRDLILLLAVTLGLLVAINVALIDGLKRDLADTRIEIATAKVHDEVRALLGPVEQVLLIARDNLIAADLGPDDYEALGERFIPTLSHIDQIAGAVLALDDGSEYFLRRDASTWLTRLRGPGDPTELRLLRDGGGSDETSEEQIAGDGYDPRERPWYRAALEADGEIAWTSPYVFHSRGEPGVTAAISWQQNDQTRVLALDVALARITDTVAQLGLGEQGRGFLFSSAGGVYLPGDGDQGSAGERGELFSADDAAGGPLLFDAVSAWQNAGRPSDQLVAFESGGQRWWGGFQPFAVARDAWIGVAIPASATVGVLQSRWHLVALTVLAISGLGIGLAMLLVRKYSHQLRDLPKRSIDSANAEADIYGLIHHGEDTHVEFKSTMRTNLHTGKPGKEIELAWLKGVTAFLNTEGGVLLMGVADDGTVLGLDADKFDNEDRCRLHFKNLLNQHLGPEYARNVRLDIFSIDEKRIAAVECEPADAPVFLRHKDKEQFLIRSGPSNIELSMSRALNYIRGRF